MRNYLIMVLLCVLKIVRVHSNNKLLIKLKLEKFSFEQRKIFVANMYKNIDIFHSTGKKHRIFFRMYNKISAEFIQPLTDK